MKCGDQRGKWKMCLFSLSVSFKNDFWKCVYGFFCYVLFFCFFCFVFFSLCELNKSHNRIKHCLYTASTLNSLSRILILITAFFFTSKPISSRYEPVFPCKLLLKYSVWLLWCKPDKIPSSAELRSIWLVLIMPIHFRRRIISFLYEATFLSSSHTQPPGDRVHSLQQEADNKLRSGSVQG